MKYLEKFFKCIFNLIIVILVIVVLILVYNVVQVNVLKKEYVNIFGYSFFQVATGSMADTIQTNDIVIVKITKDVQEGDIITFNQNGNIITHRIVQINNGKILTKGDANNAVDEEIEYGQVIGKVVYIFKDIEVWKNVFQTPTVYIPMIITILLFGISFSIKENNQE